MLSERSRKNLISSLNKCKDGIIRRAQIVESLSSWFDDDVEYILSAWASHFTADNKITTECLCKFDSMTAAKLVKSMYDFGKFHALNESVSFRDERIFWKTISERSKKKRSRAQAHA